MPTFFTDKVYGKDMKWSVGLNYKETKNYFKLKNIFYLSLPFFYSIRTRCYLLKSHNIGWAHGTTNLFGFS